MATTFVRPHLCCPSCGGQALSKERLYFHSDGTRSIDSEYRADLADELTGLSLKCMGCGYEFGVSRVTVYTDDGQEIYY